MRLQSFDYVIKHISGKENIADPLSRLCQREESSEVEKAANQLENKICRIVDAAVPTALSFEEIREASQNDPKICQVLDLLPTSKEWPRSLVQYQVLQHELAEFENVLLWGDRIIIPTSLRAQILNAGHEGHPGIMVMRRRLRAKVWRTERANNLNSVAYVCRMLFFTVSVLKNSKLFTTIFIKIYIVAINRKRTNL
jgi:uncharacterized alpha-E superfamily protein